MSMFSLAISCLTTSNLLWFMGLSFQVPMQHCIDLTLQHQTYFHHQLHPQLGMFLLWLCLFSLAGVTSPLFFSSILGTYGLEEFIFQCHIFFPFHTVHGVLKEAYWSAFPFPSPADYLLSELSPITCLSWVALHHMARGFTELDKAVILVICLVSFLWLWFSFCLPSDG